MCCDTNYFGGYAMNYFSTYDTTTGQILMSGYTSGDILLQQFLPTHAVVPVQASPALDYVDTTEFPPEVKPRPNLPQWPGTVVRTFDTVSGSDIFVLDMSLMPNGTSVTVTNENNESLTTSDKNDPITLVDPETYVVIVNPPFPYVGFTQTIEVE